MWFSVVCTLIDNEYASSQWSKFVVTTNFDHCNDGYSLSIRVHTTLNHIRFVFYHNIKVVDNLYLKVHALHYVNELLVRVRRSFQKLLHPQHAETVRKNVWKKSSDAFSLSIRVQTTLNHISICFFSTTSTSKKLFFQNARSSAS